MDITDHDRPIVPRISLPTTVHCTPLLANRTFQGMVMACPFVVCFSLFGTFNLIAGTILTAMACRPRQPPLHNPLLREYNKRLDTLLDPLKVVGPILLITGTMLVVVGISLGVVACRSVHVQRASRQLSVMNGIASYSGALQTSIPSALAVKRTHHHLAVPVDKPARSSSPILPEGISKIEMHRLDVVGPGGQEVRMCEQETSLMTSSYERNCGIMCANCRLEALS